MVKLIHKKFIESRLKKVINQKGVIYIGNNLNKYISLEDATNNWKSNKQKNERTKASKDAELGRLVQEIIIYLLEYYFKLIKAPLLIIGKEDYKKHKNIKELVSSLGIKRKNVDVVKLFDSDIIIINKENYVQSKNAFVLSCKGTTRERIGQFFSHLFLMDKEAMNVKYGDKYEIMFIDKGIKIKYALVTLDWAKNRDFDKLTPKGELRKTLKELEGFLIEDDKIFGGGLYVLNNYEHLSSVKSFEDLVKVITSFLN